MEQLVLLENGLTAQDYIRLRKCVGWDLPTPSQAKKAIDRSLYTLAVADQGEVIAMSRLVGDGVIYMHVQDVVVLEPYRARGVGRMMIEKLIAHIKDTMEEHSIIKVGLMCAKGKESFYEHFGFLQRPTETHGPGMLLTLEKDDKKAKVVYV